MKWRAYPCKLVAGIMRIHENVSQMLADIMTSHCFQKWDKSSQQRCDVVFRCNVVLWSNMHDVRGTDT
jgi:hypothetical protein